jgi:hypothetical protein
MISRCDDKNGDHFKDYGERGITVCKEWHEYVAFRQWALANGYQDTLTIDRIDVNGNYEPSNCRWATMKEQQNNKRSNKKIEYNEETLTAAEWSEKLGNSKILVSERLRYGWNTIKAITTPPNRAENLREDIAGKRYGSLVAIRFAKSRKTKSGKSVTYWLFRCDCGKDFVTQKSSVVSGKARSCGCSRKKH